MDENELVGAVEATYEGGPVDGRVMAVETTADELVPDALMPPETGVYPDSSDDPAPAHRLQDPGSDQMMPTATSLRR